MGAGKGATIMRRTSMSLLAAQEEERMHSIIPSWGGSDLSGGEGCKS